MKTIIIDRSKWRTGVYSLNKTGEGNTKLTNEQGYKCCLGFICSAYKKKTLGLLQPMQTNCKIPFLTELDKKSKYYFDTDITKNAIVINDDSSTSPQKKEKLLKKLFDGKFNLVFEGKYDSNSSKKK